MWEQLPGLLSDSGTRLDVHLTRLSSFDDVRSARRRGIHRLVLQPECVLKAQRALKQPNELQSSLGMWRMGRIVAISSPSTDVRAVHTVSSFVRCALFVIGVDSSDQLREELGIGKADRELVTSEKILDAVAAWPAPLRDAVASAVFSPGEWTVKKVAAAGGVTRRTLERRFERAGVPGPATVLKLADDPDNAGY